MLLAETDHPTLGPSLHITEKQNADQQEHHRIIDKFVSAGIDRRTTRNTVLVPTRSA